MLFHFRAATVRTLDLAFIVFAGTSCCRPGKGIPSGAWFLPVALSLDNLDRGITARSIRSDLTYTPRRMKEQIQLRHKNLSLSDGILHEPDHGQCRDSLFKALRIALWICTISVGALLSFMSSRIVKLSPPDAYVG